MRTNEELDWIKSAQAGDLNAYGKLIDKYQDMVFTVSLRILKNRHDAEDLSQDVLIKIFKNLSSFETKSSFGAWIYRICYNESINKYRKLKRSREKADIIEHEKENWSERASILDLMEQTDRRKIIMQAIHQLDEDDSFVIMAYYFEELSVKEICETTNLTESNVKIKLHRSRKRLHKILSRPSQKENLV